MWSIITMHNIAKMFTLENTLGREKASQHFPLSVLRLNTEPSVTDAWVISHRKHQVDILIQILTYSPGGSVTSHNAHFHKRLLRYQSQVLGWNLYSQLTTN